MHFVLTEDDDYDEGGSNATPTVSSTTSSSSTSIATTSLAIATDQSSHDPASPAQGYIDHSVKDNMSEAQKREQLISVVQQLFPLYKPDSWLRCSVLFPPKPSSLPRPWQDCKKPHKRKKQTECSSPKRLRFGKIPPPEMCLSDDEVSVFYLFIYLLSIFVNDRGHTKGISLYRVLPHKNYTQHTTIPNKQLQKQIHTQTIR